MYVYFLFTLAGIALAMFACAYLLPRADIIKLLVMGMAGFFTCYLVISAALLYLDVFRVSYALAVTATALFIADTVLLLRRRGLPSGVSFHIKDHLLLLILSVCLLPFVALKSENIATTNDAGAYTLRAIDLMYGDTGIMKEYGEYAVADEKTKEEFLRLADTEMNMIVRKDPGGGESLQYDYHALPAWPALLALSGKAGGYDHLYDIMTVLYLLAVWLMYFLLDSICGYRPCRYLAILLFGFLPLAVYLGKTSLSEMCYVTMVLFSVLLLVQKENGMKLLAALPLSSLAFIHFSTFMYAPVIWLSLLAVYICTRNKAYGVVNIAVHASYALSFFYADAVSHIYTRDQLYSLFSGDPRRTLLLLAGMMFLFALLQGVAMRLAWRGAKVIQRLDRVFGSHALRFFRFAALFLFALTIFRGYQLGFTDSISTSEKASWGYRAFYVNAGLSGVAHLNIVSIVMGTAYLPLAIIGYYLLRSKRRAWTGMDLVLSAVMLYSIAIYTVIRPDTPLNYYASRYFFIVLIPSIVLLAARMIKGRRLFFCVAAVAVATALPYNALLLHTSAESGNFALYNDVSTVIPANSVVMLTEDSPHIHQTLFHNLREINGCRIYNSASRDWVDGYFDDSDIYLVTTGQESSWEYQLIFEKTYAFGPDIAAYNGFYPLTYKPDALCVRVYRYVRPYYVVDMKDSPVSRYDGFYEKELSGTATMAWTKETSSLFFWFAPYENAVCNIRYAYLPEDIFSAVKEIVVSAYMDGSFLGEEAIDYERRTAGLLSFPVPEELFQNGMDHVLTLHTTTWKPSEVQPNSPDDRSLGIPVIRVEMAADNNDQKE